MQAMEFAKRAGSWARTFLPALWTVAGSVFFCLLVLGHTVDLSWFLPDSEYLQDYVGWKLNGYDPRGRCNMCGVIAQVLDNNLLPAMNPFYGMRTTYSLDDDELSREVNAVVCRENPCRPGCQGLADAISTRVNSETFSAFNRTLTHCRALGLDMESFAVDEVIIPFVINKDSQLLEYRFTMMTSEERELVFPRRTGFDGTQPPQVAKAAPHVHSYDMRGVCSQCGRIRTTSECKSSDVYPVFRRFVELRARHSPQSGCASCGIVQDFATARPTQISTNGGKGTMDYSSAWFLQYPVNAETARLCHRFCEGRHGWKTQLDVAAMRMIVRYRLKAKLRTLYEMPRVVFFMVSVLTLSMFVGPNSVMHGNLLWRNTLHGMPTPGNDSPISLSANRLSRNGVPLGASRFRRR